MLWERCLAMAFTFRKPGSPGQLLARKMSTAKGALHRKVGSVPISDICSAARILFDHLVRQRHKVRWQFNARGPRGLEVDDKLVACRLLEREIGRARTGKDAGGQ